MKRSGFASRISFAEVRALAGKERWDKILLDQLDRFLGAAILLTPAVLGPPGVFALSLLEPKDELIKIGRSFIQRFATSTTDDFVAQHRRMTAAYCLMTYTAFFSALDLKLSRFAKTIALSDEERRILVDQAIKSRDPAAAQAEDAGTIIEIPHPAIDPKTERTTRIRLYGRMAQAYLRFVQGLAVWESSPSDLRRMISEAMDTIPNQAAEVFDAQYLALLIEFPTFHRWAELYEFTKTQQLNADLATGIQDKIMLVAEATQGIDVGLRRLERLITAITPTIFGDNLIERVTEGLRNKYISNIEEPVISDRYVERGAAALTYPRKCDIFIPQAFQTIRSLDPHMRLELDTVWVNLTVHQDLGAFTKRYLDSPYSTEAPLLVLGHPGSGKSLFSEMTAARFASPVYHPIRIELRDIDADAELQDQVEHQIRLDTGYEVNWAVFADELRENPPVIILDGYDELLQASGKVFSNYLTKVQSFQRREAIQGRPVRVVVTSRITLIDKAVIPEGATIVRLLDFDSSRLDRWIDVWNATNSVYFASNPDVEPFELPHASQVTHLAEQPLLLLMLAVYDSSANQLRNADLDRTLLYHSLLVRFIERERTKGVSADAFMALTPIQRREQVESDLERLGVAAIGMFNRRALHIQRDDLNKDIAYFDLAHEPDNEQGPTLSPAELLLGSFFFIHESKSHSGRDIEEQAGMAFEFLHNTFGEFLAADFILREVLAETRVIRKLGNDPQLLSMREQHLDHPPTDWFPRLIYTSLHTRPVVYSMMREWLVHRLAADGRETGEFEEDLALLILRQLAGVLSGNVPPIIMQQPNASPYDSLPILGHFAVYSLNLVLLWLALTRGDVSIEEAALNVPLAGCRPWDRLTNLWRSWFSLESLTGLPPVLRAQRKDGTVTLSLPSGETVRGATKLEDVYNIAHAFADNIVYGLAAPHVFDLAGAAVEDLASARARLITEDIGLSSLIDARMTDGGLPWIRNVAASMLSVNDVATADYLYRRILDVFERSRDQYGLAKTYRQIGQLRMQMGQHNAAEDMYRRSLEIFERTGDQSGVANTYHQIGQLRMQMGQLDAAEDMYRRSLEIFERTGDQSGVANTYHQIGQLRMQMGQLDAAEDMYRRSLEIFERTGDQSRIAFTHNMLGWIAQAQEQFAEAESYYRRALEFYLEVGDRYRAAEIYSQFGRLAQAQEQFAEAESYYRRALEFYLEVGDRYRAAEIYSQFGRLAQAQEQFAEAESYYRRALEFYLEVGSRYRAAEIYSQFGRLAQAQEQFAEAESYYRQALDIQREMGIRDHEAVVGLSETLAALGRHDEASKVSSNMS